MKKAHFAINVIPDKHTHISGRCYNDLITKQYDVHIGKIFYNCNQDILKGGGLAQAGGANSTKSVDDILTELSNTASKLYPKDGKV